MPELPEVETVRHGLEGLLKGAVIRRAHMLRPDIRFVIPADLPSKIAGQPVLGVRRRAKYLLIDTPSGTLLSHLGMTGTWRLSVPGQEDKHDHFYLDLFDGRRLAFRDPRRFGMIDWLAPGDEPIHPRLRTLGPEPLPGSDWSAEGLYLRSRGRKVGAKVFIMDQKVVVGVGNIYASEALFRARIRPSRPAGRLTKSDCERIVDAVCEVLEEAIKLGGSTISDFKGAGGGEGYFQSTFRVYGRAGRSCQVCGVTIRQKALGGRSTFWCGSCQR